MDGQRHAIDQAMRDRIGLMVNGPILKRSPGRISRKSAFIEQSVLFELVFYVGERELSGEDGDVEFGEQPGTPPMWSSWPWVRQ